jgi:hypothetical protein
VAGAEIDYMLSHEQIAKEKHAEPVNHASVVPTLSVTLEDGTPHEVVASGAGDPTVKSGLLNAHAIEVASLGAASSPNATTASNMSGACNSAPTAA